MASITGSDLRCRVEVLRRTAVTNALNETDYTYASERKVWARIVPTSGSRKDVEGGMEQVEVTHRFTVRRGSIPTMTTDLRLRFRGQDYQVVSFYPNYRDGGFVDLFVKLVVEDGVPSF